MVPSSASHGTYDQKTVYVVDVDKGCIGLTMDGNVVFQYQDQKVKFYAGLAVGRDCLFIRVKQGDYYKVRRLSLSGDYLGDMDLGNSVPRKMIDNNLIIFNEDVKWRPSIQFFYLLEQTYFESPINTKMCNYNAYTKVCTYQL